MAFLLAIIGLVIGSFLNAAVFRLNNGVSLVSGRSFCPKCKKKIFWFDNIPLFSFFLLGGKCRNCHRPISWRYPILEALTAIFTVAVYLSASDFFQLVWLLIVVWSLLLIFFSDLEYFIIPDGAVVVGVAASLIYWLAASLVFSSATPLLLRLGSAIGAMVFFLSLYLITSGKGMGMGDAKLAFLMGLALGWPRIIWAVFGAFITGSAAGVFLLAVGKKRWKDRIAFGPFLSASTVIFILWGQKAINFIMGILTKTVSCL